MQTFLAVTTAVATSLSASHTSIPTSTSSAILPNQSGVLNSIHEQFYLKTKVRFPNPLHRFASVKESRYVATARSGSGDLVLVGDRQRASRAALSGGEVELDDRFSNSKSLMRLYKDPNRDADWHPVRSVTGSDEAATRGFYVNASNMRLMMWEGPDYLDDGSENTDQWRGWVACDWFHDDPQLFWFAPKGPRYSLPDSCDLVELVLEQ